MKASSLLFLLVVFAGSTLHSQDEQPVPPKEPSPKEVSSTEKPPHSVVSTLRGLIDSMESIRAEQSEARAEFDALKKASANATELKAAEDRIKAAADELALLQKKFEELATGINQAAFESEADEEVNLQEELRTLIEPLLYELRKSTERPREIERLRSEASAFLRKEEMSRKSLAKLDLLIPQVQDQKLKESLEKLRESWNTRNERVNNELDTANLQLAEALEKQESIFGVMGDFMSNFLVSRGKSFGLAVLGGAGAFFLLTLLIRLGERFVSDKEELRRSMPFRLTRLLLFVVAGLLGICTFLGILYAQSDWLLLGLSLIFILGLLWAGKQAILPFYEQLKTVLNLGPVREGERVIFDGIPWEVKSINFYTDLVNPMLTGGHVRVSLADLTGLHSRPKARKEPLFPCKVGSWVQLSDGTYGEVISQTPELVRLRTVPGSVVSYQTPAFLGLAPDNHSDTFGVRVPVGIDYQHQELSTTKIREILEVYIKAGLEQFIGAQNIKALWVEFSSASASSLDYVVGVTLSGEVAGRKPALTRAVQRLFVDACNQHGWVIPFTQVTIHQAAA